MADEPPFVIEPRWVDYRYLLTGGRTMDVRSPYGADSTDRERVLVEAHRRWGGSRAAWKIEGVAQLGNGKGQP